ncbi:phage tail fiber protein [Aquisediminimonas sediminicola]|uniref:phage tail fiber domain-containing protein n=1 Tax=Alteraquisediminimonas sediminicola TaxID=2676787 RepID=UPI001C8ECFB7|nr:phage tail fiber protein [Aquisediminimonas sediminicola]
MPDTGIRYSMNKFTGDGVTVTREISFSGGYLLASHVKSYYTDLAGAIINVPFTFAGPNTITTTTPVPTGRTHVVYRATPVTGPYADFTDGAGITEANLDSNAKQAVFAAAELTDAFNEQVTAADAFAVAAAASAVASAASAAAASSSEGTATADATSALASKNASAASEAAAGASQTSATASASTATTKAAEALASASSATASASTATTQAGTATTQAGIATTQAGIATTQAGNANTSALAASAAQTATEAARDATFASFDSFDDRYLGPKAANPTLDNDGNALLAGTLYFNNVATEMRIYTGSAWVAAYVSGTGFVAKTGDTMTGKLNTVASAVGSAGLNLAPGVAPTTPVNGDVWSTTTGLYTRYNGVDYQLAPVGHTHTAFTGLALTDPVITGAILEDIYTIADGAAFEIDPGNGTIQAVVLGASRTPKATNFANGESVTLSVDDGTAYALTWTDTTFGASGVKWVGGTAPTLAATGLTWVTLWKVGGQVYGALTGASA